MAEGNKTSITTFTLLGFGSDSNLQFPLFLSFLMIYNVTIAGNIIIIVLVISDHHLHIPMYFLLGNLSFLETCYSSTLLPKVLVSFLTGDKSISVAGCLTQLYWFGSLVVAECYVLAVMSYDRYLAVCKPLQYTTLMNGRLCFQLSAGSWLYGIAIMILVISLMSQLNFCGPNEIDHFFCDFALVVKLSCSDPTQIIQLCFVFSAINSLPPFLLTMTSYACIISAILKMSSTSGKRKAFSTCSSHLIVVSLFYSSLIIVYVLPKNNELGEMNRILSVLYTVLTPLLNPIIYSLRNKEVKGALKRLISKYIFISKRNRHF
ncbi:olfactory receptor 6B1-like [Tiliqua scincoides]|uniref:olfactory receptor 6B1-like n=1 Tax=Tiliqua scincoides TaxID=71010 RepID=UPI003462530F